MSPVDALGPLDCPHRQDVRCEPTHESAVCLLLSKAFDSADERLVRVRRDACDSCNTVAQTHGRPNHVVASLLFGRALQRLKEDPHGPRSEHLTTIKEEFSQRLLQVSSCVNQRPGAQGVLGVGERRLPTVPVTQRHLSWSAAVLPSRSHVEVMTATLRSLEDAGFDNIRLFAEPGIEIPPTFSVSRLASQSKGAGQLGNFCAAAQSMLDARPDVDCYGFFDSDISAASGLRTWCDRQFWPGGHDVVSLFTHRFLCDCVQGWQTLNLGRLRFSGVLALVFNRAALLEFLADHGTLGHRESDRVGVVPAVGEWALRRGSGIACHSPSLVEQRGKEAPNPGDATVFSAKASRVRQVDDLLSWQPPKLRLGQIGLIGWNTRTGVGYQNRDLAQHLEVARWLALPHPRYRRLPQPHFAGEYLAPWTRWASSGWLRAWLDGLDWLLFVEHPIVPGLVQLAREMGVRVACVPNWEFISPAVEWLGYVDLMLCPTAHTFRLLRRWRQEFGFAWDAVYAPWPIDPKRFDFRRRQRCSKFLFVNGNGGLKATYSSGRETDYRRKGIEVITAAAKLLRTTPFLVYSQSRDLPAMPSNVEIRPAPDDNRKLYVDGDVCVQPSHWEGLGLQLLECQAAGLPLVTTDAPPMNECEPFRVVPTSGAERVYLVKGQPIDSVLIQPATLAGVLEEIYESDLREASDKAYAYIERERSWSRLTETFRTSLSG